MSRFEKVGVESVEEMLTLAIDRINSFKPRTIQCVVIDAKFREAFAERILCTDAKRLLLDYDGEHELLFMSGFLMNEDAPAIIIPMPSGSIAHFRTLVEQFKVALDAARAKQAIAAVAWLGITQDKEVLHNFQIVAREAQQQQQQENNDAAEMARYAEDKNSFAVECERGHAEFPQQLIDDVLAHMRRMSEDDHFCMVVETEARIGLARRFPNMSACKLLMEYEGSAPYLVLMGELLKPTPMVQMITIETDTYDALRDAVDWANVQMGGKGKEEAIWLTVSRRPQLIRYFERYLGRNIMGGDDSPPPVMH